MFLLLSGLKKNPLKQHFDHHDTLKTLQTDEALE